MALNIKIEVRGGENTLKRLREAGVNLNDFRDELRDVGKFLVDFYQGPVFETEGGITGERWAPLKPAYEFWKRRVYPGRGILEASGTMRRGFQFAFSSTSLRVYNLVKYFIYHQMGTRKMPSRVIFKLDEARIREIVKIIKTGLFTRISRALS